MKKQTLGRKIAEMRKAKGMTQQQLAEEMGLTDKAVSKWERDLSCPDVTAIPRLAQVLGVGVEELMGSGGKDEEKREDIRDTVALILKAVPLAMGVAVTVLAVLGQIEVSSALIMLGLGLACLALGQMQKQ